MVESKIAETQHLIFPTTRKGDTLIVAPTGPLSQFAHSQVRAEIRRVKNLLLQDSVKNLIIDLSGSQYFGTSIIGAIMEFKESFAKGQTVLCGVSSDMTIAVELCQLDDALPTYETRKLAIRKISHIPLSDRLLPGGTYVKFVTSLSILAMVVFVVWATKLPYKILGSPVVADYQTLQHVWIEAQTKDPNHSTEQQARQVSAELTKIQAIQNSIAATGVPSDHKSVKLAAESLEIVLKQHDFNGKASSAFLHNMHSARLNLRRRTSLSVQPIKRIEESTETTPTKQLTALNTKLKMDQRLAKREQ